MTKERKEWRTRKGNTGEPRYNGPACRWNTVKPRYNAPASEGNTVKPRYNKLTSRDNTVTSCYKEPKGEKLKSNVAITDPQAMKFRLNNNCEFID